MNIQDVTVSFIIPALNESEHLPATLGIIRQLLGSCDDVIVADNGSTDATVQIAAEFGAKVALHPGVTIGELRNLGAKLSEADVFIFIDADVHLDPSWPDKFTQTLKTLSAAPLTVTGSRCRASTQGSFVSRYWYSRLNNENNMNYINSGHLIVTRQLFEKINGFTAELTTGEDYDFCQRALQAGAILKPDSQLIAWHEGYPATLKGFFQREMWHGRNEYTSMALFLSSKVALLSAFNLTLMALAILCTLLTMQPLFIGGYLAFSILLCCALTYKKFGFAPPILFIGTCFMYYCYLLARGLAWRYKAARPAARNHAKEAHD